MAIDQQIVSFFPHTVTITPYVSKNSYGEEVLGTPRTAKAYVEPNISISNGTTVDEQSSQTVAYINDLTITVRDAITLPNGFTPVISSIELHTAVAGLEHTVVRF